MNTKASTPIETAEHGSFVRHDDGRTGILLDHDFAGGGGAGLLSIQCGFDRLRDLTGWHVAELVEPGHVQVRVDDLDLSAWLFDHEDQHDDDDDEGKATVRVARAAAGLEPQS